MHHHASTFFFRIFACRQIVGGVERISVTFTKDSPVTLDMLEARALQLRRSTSDYILLVVQVHLGLAPKSLLIPPDGKLEGLTPEQSAILSAAAEVIQARDAKRSLDATNSTAMQSALDDVKRADAPRSTQPNDTRKRVPRRLPKSRQK